MRVGREEKATGEVAVHRAGDTNGRRTRRPRGLENGVDTERRIHAGVRDPRELREEFGEARNLVTGYIASDASLEHGVDCTPISGRGIDRED